MTTQTRIYEETIFENLPIPYSDVAIFDMGYATRYSLLLSYNIGNDFGISISYQDVYTHNDPDHPSQFYSADNEYLLGQSVYAVGDDTPPSPLLPGHYYYVIPRGNGFFSLAETLELAIAKTPIEILTTGTGSVSFQPTSLEDAYIYVQKGNSYDGPWVDIISPIHPDFSNTDGTQFINVDEFSHRFLRVEKTLFQGAFEVTGLFLAYGTGA